MTVGVCIGRLRPDCFGRRRCYLSDMSRLILISVAVLAGLWLLLALRVDENLVICSLRLTVSTITQLTMNLTVNFIAD
jgi:hypothetical protein